MMNTKGDYLEDISDESLILLAEYDWESFEVFLMLYTLDIQVKLEKLNVWLFMFLMLYLAIIKRLWLNKHIMSSHHLRQQ